MGTGIEDPARIKIASRGICLRRFRCLNMQLPDLAITATVEIRIRKQDQSRGVIVQVERSLIVPSTSAQAVLYYYSNLRYPHGFFSDFPSVTYVCEGNSGADQNKCIFPFIYNGTRYFECTSFEKGIPWCSTKNDVNGIMEMWSYCLCPSKQARV